LDHYGETRPFSVSRARRLTFSHERSYCLFQPRRSSSWSAACLRCSTFGWM